MAPKKVDKQFLEYLDKLVNEEPYRGLTPATGRALLEYIKTLEQENKSGGTNMKLSKETTVTSKELKEVSEVAKASIDQHIDYIIDECVHMAGMGYSYASFENYQPKMTKDELKGLVNRLVSEHKLSVKVDPYEKEFVDTINIYIEWK